MNIRNLPSLVAQLPSPQQSMLAANIGLGELQIPGPLIPKVAGWYRDDRDPDQSSAIERASKQDIIRTFNNYTFESTMFNWLRSRRPVVASGGEGLLDAAIEAARNKCDFCDPKAMTASDFWGRCGDEKYALTASNIAKYDQMHGLVIFKEHHPHRFGSEEIEAYLQAARDWLLRAYAAIGTRSFPFILWNAGSTAGASIAHGHLQMTMNRVGPYGKQELLNAAARRYAEDYPGRDYWRDWTAAHSSMALALEIYDDIFMVASMTPVKEREAVIVDQRSFGSVLDASLAKALNLVLRTFIDRLGVKSFNVGMYLPTMDQWDAKHPPIIIRVVDRGDPSPAPLGKLKTADVGAMELYGASVVASDPFLVIGALKAQLAASHC